MNGKDEISRTVLAVDTSNGKSSLAVYRGPDEIYYGVSQERDNLGWLRAEVQAIEQKCQFSLADVDLFAVVNGPGALTGVRVGFGFVQALALGLNKPIVGINSLATMALQLLQSQGGKSGSGVCAVALDARMGEIYSLAFPAGSNLSALVEVDDELITPNKSFQSDVAAGFVAVAGPGYENYADILPKSASLVNGIVPDARAAAQIALLSKGGPATQLGVHYLRHQQHVAKIPERLREKTD